MNLLQFIKYKTYIGHSKKNTPLLSSWLLYTLRNNIWTINIFKTILIFKFIIVFIKYLIINNFPIWFINLDRSKEFIINKNANFCGEFNCTRSWVRGILSNYFNILNCLNNFVIKKDAVKNYKINNLYNKWYMTRFTWPRALLLFSLKFNYIVAKEAYSMYIPIIALIDTDIKSHLFNFPIICNDDSIDSISFFCFLLSKLILLYKFNKVILWFYNCRNKSKLNLINNWTNNLLKKKNFNNFSFLNIISKGITLLFKVKNLNINIINKKNEYNNIKLLNIYFFNKLNFYSDFFVSMWYSKYSIFFNRLNFYNKKGFFSKNLILNPLFFHYNYIYKKKKIKIKNKSYNFKNKNTKKNIQSKKKHFWFLYFLYFYYIKNLKVVMELFSKNNNWLSLLNIKFLKKRIYFRFFRNLKSLKFKFKVNRLFWYLFPIKKYYIKKENNNRHYNTNKFFIMFKNYRQLIKKKILLIKKKFSKHN
jgi:ribosomal protein S2